MPVVDVQRRASYPGGAANVARNLASLGAAAGLAGVIGDDEPGKSLVTLLAKEKIATGSIRATNARPTTHKTRICAITRQVHEHLEIEDQQQIVRVDEEERARPSTQQPRAGSSIGYGRRSAPTTRSLLRTTPRD